MITNFKIYESFVESKNGNYVNRNGTIVFHDNHISIVVYPYTEHSSKYHIYS